jgi:hypothetical protein
MDIYADLEETYRVATRHTARTDVCLSGLSAVL